MSRLALFWGGFTLVVASLLAVEVTAPELFHGDAVIPLDYVYQAEANRLAVAGASPAELERADALSVRQLELSPLATSAWLRRAYIATLRGHGFNADSQSYLRKSFEAVALDPDLWDWRDHFALEHWSALTPELRLKVIKELQTAAPVMPGRAKVLKDSLSDIHDPSGRLTAALFLPH